MGVDDDLQLGDPRRPGGWGGHIGSGLFTGAGRLPKHRVATPGSGEHQLGTVLPAPVGHHVDGRTPTDARK